MALPANISTRWVEGQFLTNVNDGPDPDQRPDSVAAQGVVTFVAAVPYLPDATAEPNPATLLMIPRVAVLDEAGYICTPVRGTLTPAYRGIMLECTDDPDGSVTGWTWNVKYAFKPIDGVTPIIDSHSFPLPTAEEALDLTTVVKVPSSVGIGKEQAEILAASAQAAAQSAALNVIDALAAVRDAQESARQAAADLVELGGNTAEAVEREISTEGTLGNAAIANFVGQTVPPQVRTLTAQYLAEDGAVADAAASAVDTALDGADVITGTDARILQRTMETDYTIPFGDAEGYIAGGFRSDGRFQLARPPVLPKGSFDSGILDASRGIGPLDPNSGFMFGSVDPDGYVSWGIRTDGSVYAPGSPGSPSAPVTSSRTQILAAGDSMVRGGTVAADGSGHETWPYEDGWPAKLQAILSGVTVLNQGYGGRTVDDVRWHTGAMPIWVEFPGGTIPAARGEHPVIVRQAVGTTSGTVGTFYGWVGGTNGNLKKLADGSWVFDKYNATAAIPAPGKMAYTRGGTEGFMSSTAIFWNGRNDVSFNIAGAQADVVEHVEASIAEQVAALSPQNPQFLVLSVTNRVQEAKGTAAYEKVVAINERLRRRWPGHFIDIRTWLVNEAIHEAGLTPTKADLDNMAADAPPPQIMDQGTHYLKFIAPLIAAKLKTHLEERGYC